MLRRKKFTCKKVKLTKAIYWNSTLLLSFSRLYDLEPDRTVTGGAWYSGQDFESEFVEILNQQCFRFLYQKLEKSRECTSGPIAARNMATASSKEVLNFISELGISKVQLKVEEIESILNTLIFDGKVEKTVSDDGEVRYYRAVEPLLPPTGLVRTPCGVCPVIANCSTIGSVTPAKCQYLKEWLS